MAGREARGYRIRIVRGIEDASMRMDGDEPGRRRRVASACASVGSVGALLLLMPANCRAKPRSSRAKKSPCSSSTSSMLYRKLCWPELHLSNVSGALPTLGDFDQGR